MMMERMSTGLWILLLTMSTTTSTTAFLYTPQAHPNLEVLMKHIETEETSFKLRLDLGVPSLDPRQRAAHFSLPRIALTGPSIKLLSTTQTSSSSSSSSSSKSQISLPGEAPAHSRASTGRRAIQVLERPSFVGMNGLETVPLDNACWEIVWMEDHHSGKLVCAFDLPMPIHRNGVTFDESPIYISLDVYSQESLAAAQALKETTQSQSNVYMHEKAVELGKMKTASNPIIKALHYQRAFSAFDKMLLLPAVSHIPESNQVMALSPDLFMAKQGVVWKKLNALLGPSSTTLGKAIVSIVKKEEQEEDGGVKNARNDDMRNSKLRP